MFAMNPNNRYGEPIPVVSFCRDVLPRQIDGSAAGEFHHSGIFRAGRPVLLERATCFACGIRGKTEDGIRRHRYGSGNRFPLSGPAVPVAKKALILFFRQSDDRGLRTGGFASVCISEPAQSAEASIPRG